MDFVWIYAKAFSHFARRRNWNELEYSVKSVRKFYPEAVCWVVGDDPELDVNHIYVDRIMTHPTNLPIDMDVIRKFRTIIASEIGEEFVLMYDDIYFLQCNDLRITYGYRKVDDIDSYRRNWSRQYKYLWKNTYRLIEELGVDMYDWEAHLPRLFEKKKLEWILDKYNCDEVPLIATSLYAAHFCKDTVLMDDSIQFNLYDHAQSPVQLDYDEGFKKKYMNLVDDAITPSFIQKMTEVFGEGTSFKSTHR